MLTPYKLKEKLSRDLHYYHHFFLVVLTSPSSLVSSPSKVKVVKVVETGTWDLGLRFDGLDQLDEFVISGTIA